MLTRRQRSSQDACTSAGALERSALVPSERDESSRRQPPHRSSRTTFSEYRQPCSRGPCNCLYMVPVHRSICLETYPHRGLNPKERGTQDIKPRLQCVRRVQGQAGLGGTRPIGHFSGDAIVAGSSSRQPQDYWRELSRAVKTIEGAASPVRRNLYPLDSAPAKGVHWEWRTNSGKWCPYSVQLSCRIEKAKEQGLTKINLQEHYPECIYTVEFPAMHQRNNFSGFIRVIRRVDGKSYPLTADAITCPGVDLNVPESLPKKRRGRRSGHAVPSFSFGVPCKSENASAAKKLKTEGLATLDNIKIPKSSWTDNSSQDPPATQEFLAEYTAGITGTVPTDCSICCQPLGSCSSYNASGKVVCLSQCSHHFHHGCLAALYESNPKAGYLQCPVCKVIYGVKHGNQPPGIMSYLALPFSLAGHESYGTIQITYHIAAGIQGPEHPHPGMPYSARGFPRHGYLPNTEQGQRALKLLVEAWDRRLIFTISQSNTTAEQDTVTWNKIHHKTEFGADRTGHGYPDPSYLDNLFAELQAQGVTDESVRDA